MSNHAAGAIVRSAPRKLISYSRSVYIEAKPEDVFCFCATRKGFERHFPHRVRNYDGPDDWEIGCHFKMQYRVMGMWMQWHGEVVEWEPGRRFVDVMHAGFFHTFRHEHLFEPEGTGTRYTDVLTFTLGFRGVFDKLFGLQLVKDTFNKRQRKLKDVLEGRA